MNFQRLVLGGIVMYAFLGPFYFLFALLFWLIPTLVAIKREHSNKTVFFMLNILACLTSISLKRYDNELQWYSSGEAPLFNWIDVMWIILLVWAFWEDNRYKCEGHIYERYKKKPENFSPKECSNCKSMVESDYNSCPKCGYRFEEKTEIKREVKDNWYCRKCGAVNSIKTIICRDCGTYR